MRGGWKAYEGHIRFGVERFDILAVDPRVVCSFLISRVPSLSRGIQGSYPSSGDDCQVNFSFVHTRRLYAARVQEFSLGFGLNA